MKKYGIELMEPLTPLIVRDVVINCFTQAHCNDMGMGAGNQELSQCYCKELLTKFFNKVGGDFNDPTKELLDKVIIELAEFSRNFRDKETIAKNFNEVKALIDKLS